MKTILTLTLLLFTLQVSLKAKVVKGIHEKARIIVIEKKILKNYKKKAKSIASKIKLLTAKPTLTKTEQKKLTLLKQKGHKITFWKKFRDYQKNRMEILLSESPDPYTEISKLDEKMTPLLNSYPEMTGEKFPSSFFLEVDKVTKQLRRKASDSKS